MQGQIYDAIIEAGKNHRLIHAGAHAMDIMRMEKMYLHWGHDISPEENPYQAGLGFVCPIRQRTGFYWKNCLKKNQTKSIN